MLIESKRAESSEAKQGYHHTHHDTRLANLGNLARFPSDNDIHRASTVGAADALLLLQALGMEQILLDHPLPEASKSTPEADPFLAGESGHLIQLQRTDLKS